MCGVRIEEVVEPSEKKIRQEAALFFQYNRSKILFLFSIRKQYTHTRTENNALTERSGSDELSNQCTKEKKVRKE